MNFLSARLVIVIISMSFVLWNRNISTIVKNKNNFRVFQFLQSITELTEISKFLLFFNPFTHDTVARQQSKSFRTLSIFWGVKSLETE